MMQLAKACSRFAIAVAALFVLSVPVGHTDIPPLSTTFDEGFGFERAEFGMGVTEFEFKGDNRSAVEEKQEEKHAFCFQTFNIEVCIGKRLEIHRAAMAE